jgi:predicted RNA-binding Zn ribbon-like protein
LPSWVQAGETKPAPMPLLLVQAFVNTWDEDDGRDALLEPEDAQQWLGEAGLTPRDQIPDPAGLQLAREVRESIRALLTMNGGGPAAEADALQPLHVLTGMGRLQASIGPDGAVELEPAPATPAADGPSGSLVSALFRLVLIIRDAQADGTWPRLKACRNPECRWAFYDRSHSRRGTWCDMAVCGNRIKNRTLRQRQKS